MLLTNCHVCFFKGKSFKAGGGSAVAAGSFLACFSLGLALLLSPLAPMQLLWAFQASIVPIIIVSKVGEDFYFILSFISFRFRFVFFFYYYYYYYCLRVCNWRRRSRFSCVSGLPVWGPEFCWAYRDDPMRHAMTWLSFRKKKWKITNRPIVSIDRDFLLRVWQLGLGRTCTGSIFNGQFPLSRPLVRPSA